MWTTVNSIQLHSYWIRLIIDCEQNKLVRKVAQNLHSLGFFKKE